MKKTYSEYDNFRWINCNRWSEAKEVDALVRYLVEGIPSRKSRGYRINMKALVMDLYHSYLCDTEQYIAYSRDKGDYVNTGSEHLYIKNHNVTYDYLVGCIDHLAGEGLLDNHPGGQFYDNETESFHSYVSRMRPAPELYNLINEYHVTPDMISTFTEDDVLVLRGEPKEVTYIYKGKTKTREVKPPMKAPKNKVTTPMIKIIRQYNELLERSLVDVDIECLTDSDRAELVEQLADMDVAGTKRIVLRLSNKSVYRVFNNGSLEQGGRYYGAWWISAPGLVRKYITIQGESTVEMDFSAMHIHLLYAKVGVNYADKKEDAYTLEEGPFSLKNKKDDRDLNKLILLTAFNAGSPESTAAAVFDDLRKEHKLFKYNIHDHDKIKSKLDLLKKKHPLISNMVANNYGHELQYYDSCVIEQVIKHFTSKDIPVLTVHDSVICQARHAEEVRNVMMNHFYQVLDRMLKVSITPVPRYSYAKSVLMYITNHCHYKPVAGWLTSMQQLPFATTSEYKGNITDIVPNTLNIKPTTRLNLCSRQCRCYNRIKHGLKFMPNIKLELKEMVESCTSVLVIR